MGFTLLSYCTVSNANDIFLWFNNDNKWLEHAMINNNHTFRSTANLEKMFNMCLPATSITLSKRYLNWLMHESLSYWGSSFRFSPNKSFRCCISLILWYKHTVFVTNFLKCCSPQGSGQTVRVVWWHILSFNTLIQSVMSNKNLVFC